MARQIWANIVAFALVIVALAAAGFLAHIGWDLVLWGWDLWR